MPKPQKYRDVVKVLRKNGWTIIRQGKGSHVIWGRGTQRVSITHHGSGSPVSAGIIGKLIKELDETPSSWK